MDEKGNDRIEGKKESIERKEGWIIRNGQIEQKVRKAKIEGKEIQKKRRGKIESKESNDIVKGNER